VAAALRARPGSSSSSSVIIMMVVEMPHLEQFSASYWQYLSAVLLHAALKELKH
jgi:hypothetical protein